MATVHAAIADRAVRAAIPVLVSFSSTSYTVREFTLNLSVGGIFLPTDQICEVGTRGTLKFRVNAFEEPFELAAEVVRVVPAGPEPSGQKCGLGIQFLELSDENRARLERIVEGASDGSAVESIRRSIRQSGCTLDQELRRRPVDQKLMLAVNANAQEIGALIRDGNPTVMIRLLDCPRVTAAHLIAMLRNRNLPTRVLSAVRRDRKRMSNEEVRWLFCSHPNAMLTEATAELSSLPGARLSRLVQDPNTREPIRLQARRLAQRGGPR